MIIQTPFIPVKYWLLRSVLFLYNVVVHFFWRQKMDPDAHREAEIICIENNHAYTAG